VPTIGACLAASLVGWLVEGLLEPVLGLGVAIVLALACSTVAFYFARKWLLDLRGR
jgi:hypothetical protein